MTDVTTVAFNPFEPGFTENPYDQYARLRSQDPVHQSPLGFWFLTRYEDVSRLLRDRETSVEAENADPTVNAELRAAAEEEIYGEPVDREGRSMLNLDPPDHTRLRRLVSKAFTPRVMEELRGRVQEIVDKFLDEAEEKGEIDVIRQLAFPLPFQVISEMLGMPEADRDQLREWSSTVVRTLDPVFDPEIMKAVAEAGENMRRFITDVIAWKRKEPADDLMTALIHAEEEGDMLSEEELRAQIVLLYIAGHETTVNLIGNGTLALLKNRGERERLRQDPSLDQNAVEELLRFDSPVQMTRRILLKDTEIGGKTIKKGTFVLGCLGAANRDPAKWGDDADVVRADREGANQQVSFGGGVHHCLGAHLARVEGQVAIGTLIRRFPEMKLAGEPTWNGRVNLRGLESLPVTLR